MDVKHEVFTVLKRANEPLTVHDIRDRIDGVEDVSVVKTQCQNIDGVVKKESGYYYGNL